MAERPAEFAGLGDRKGKIAPGFDADLVVFDEHSDYIISSDIIKYRHKITPYEGRKVTGLVEQTFVRGQKVYELGEMQGQPIGQTVLKKQP